MKNIIDNFISTTLSQNASIPWSYKDFRTSSFPFCPRQYGLAAYNEVNNKILSFHQRYNYHSSCALKKTMYDFWADHLWGDWKCSQHTEECGIYFTSTFLKSGMCIRCGGTSQYLGKKVTDIESNFSGTCDAVVFLDQLHGYVVFELNAKNNNIIYNAQEPYPSELYQVSAFASLLVKNYNLPIVGRAILWLGKSKPNPHKSWLYHGTGMEFITNEFIKKQTTDTQLSQGIPPLQLDGVCHTTDQAIARQCPFVNKCF